MYEKAPGLLLSADAIVSGFALQVAYESQGHRRSCTSLEGCLSMVSRYNSDSQSEGSIWQDSDKAWFLQAVPYRTCEEWPEAR